MYPKHIRLCVWKSWWKFDEQIDRLWLETIGELIARNYKEGPSIGLCVECGARTVNPRITKISLSKAVVGRRLAVEMIAVLQCDFGVVGEDLVVPVGLQKKNILKRDSREMLKARARLN